MPSILGTWDILMNKSKIPALVVAYIVAEESNDKHSKQVHYNSISESSAVEKGNGRGAWVAQSVERPTSPRVMISQSVSSSPVLGSMLTAQSLEPASDSVSPSLSAPPLLTLSLSLSLSLSVKNKQTFKKF